MIHSRWTCYLTRITKCQTAQVRAKLESTVHLCLPRRQNFKLLQCFPNPITVIGCVVNALCTDLVAVQGCGYRSVRGPKGKGGTPDIYFFACNWEMNEILRSSHESRTQVVQVPRMVFCIYINLGKVSKGQILATRKQWKAYSGVYKCFSLSPKWRYRWQVCDHACSIELYGDVLVPKASS